MKKCIQKLTILSAIILGLSVAGSAQVVVRVRPSINIGVGVRPIAPSPNHVWIDGGWVARGGRYVHTDGYWTAPRRDQYWVEGYWARARGGWVWVPGYWERGQAFDRGHGHGRRHHGRGHGRDYDRRDRW